MSSASDKHARLLLGLELGVKGQEHKALLELAAQQALPELVHSLPKSQSESLYALLYEHLSALLSAAAYADDSRAPLAAQREALDALHALFGVMEAAVQTALQAEGKTKSISAGLFRSVQAMHDALLSLPHPAASALQNSAALLCEKLFLVHARVRATVALPDAAQAGVESILPMSLSYLLLRCLETDSGAGGGGKKSDIARLYAVRTGLQAFDWTDADSSSSLRSLLCRCVVHPLFLRSIEGRRFLGWAMVSLAPASEIDTARALERMMHDTVKSNLPLSRASLHEHWGDVYFRAWKLVAVTAAGEPPSPLEDVVEEAVQDLMYLSLHASHASTARSALAVVAAGFHGQERRKLSGVEASVGRMWEPLLWRSLRTANALVRRRGVEVLASVFPLLDSVGQELFEDVGLLQSQFDALRSLLSDADTGVRVLAASAVGRVCSLWFEMIPLQSAKVLLVSLGELAGDCSQGGATVRVAAIRALAAVLDNVLSHGLLRLLLPKLSAASLFDPSPSVVAEWVALLQRVKGLKGMRYFDVSPLEDVLLSLETTRSERVAAGLADLVLNSYYPAGKGVESVLARNLVLARSQKTVWLRLTQRVHKHSSAVSEARREEFALALFAALVRAGEDAPPAPSDSGAAGGRKQKKAKSSPAAPVSDALYIDPLDAGLVGTLLSGLVALVSHCPGLQAEGGEGGSKGRFDPRGLSTLLASFGRSSAAARITLVHLAALLPAECSPDLSSISLPHLLELSAAAPEAEWAPILDCLSCWNRGGEVLHHIALSFALALGEDAPEAFGAWHREDKEKINELAAEARRERGLTASAASDASESKSSKKKQSSSDSSPVLHPLQALKYLRYMLSSERTRSLLLRDAVSLTAERAEVVGEAKELLDLLGDKAQTSLRRFADDSLGIDLAAAGRVHAQFLAGVVQAHLQLATHVHAHGKALCLRADQLAADEAMDAAQRARELAAASSTRDVDESMASLPSVDPPKPRVIEMFPSGVEVALDCMSHALLPLWSAAVDRKGVDKGGESKEDQEASSSASAAAAAAPTPEKKGAKRPKKDSSAAAVAASSSSSSTEVVSLSSLLRGHLAFLSRFSVDLLALGYVHPLCPLRPLQTWVDHLAAIVKEGNVGEENAHCIAEVLPVWCKAFYQLAVAGCSTPGFGGPLDRGGAHPTNPGYIALGQVEAFWAGLCAVARAEGAQELVRGGCVRSSVAEVLKLFSSSGKGVMPRIVLMLLRPLLDDEASPAVLEGVLAAIARCPQAVFALPAALGLFSEHLSVHQPANEAAMIQRAGDAVQQLGAMAEVCVKIPKKRHAFLTALLESTRILTSLSASVAAPSESATDAATVSSASASATVAASPLPVALVASAAPDDDAGAAPMELEGATPVKARAAAAGSPAKRSPADKENAAHSQRKAATPARGAKKSAMKKSAAAAAPAVSFWTALQSTLQQQMQALAV